MSETIEHAQHINEEHIKAMNLIGQNLYNSLGQTLSDLPDPMHETNVVLQGVSGFIANMIYRQVPSDFAECQKMLEHVNKIVLNHLKDLCKIS